MATVLYEAIRVCSSVVSSKNLLIDYSDFLTIIFGVAGITFRFCNGGELKLKYYHKSCPAAEFISQAITWDKVDANPSLPVKLLRLHYHDCFVRFRKQMWHVLTVRNDGRDSLASKITTNLPSFSDNFTNLLAQFTSKGLDITVLVTLSESNFSLQNPHSHSSPRHHLRRSTSQLHRPTTTGPSFTDFALPRHHILLSLSRTANQPPSHGLCLSSSHHKVTKDAAQQTSKVIGGATPIASSTVETITSADPAVVAGSGGALFLAYLLPPHVWSNISFSLRGYKGELPAHLLFPVSRCELTPAQMLDLMYTKNHIMIDIRLEKDKEKAGIPRLPPGARSKLIAIPLIAHGAHTIGVTRCALLARRLSNFTANGGADPSLDPNYAETLKTICSIPLNSSTSVDMDPQSALSFDSHYFEALNQNKGIFISDAALLTDHRSARLEILKIHMFSLHRLLIQ
ncbi:hypothetical protein LguiA_031142 [Lonicera macranthoides]